MVTVITTDMAIPRTKINLFKMNKQELKEYAKSFCKEEEKMPQVRTLDKSAHSSTGVNTASRHAKGGISWIDYYRAFTNPEREVFRCAACGKSISTNPDIVDMNDDVEEAEGGHILFLSKDTQDIDLEYYIVPLCPGCNNPSKPFLTLTSGTIAVKEIGATLVKN